MWDGVLIAFWTSAAEIVFIAFLTRANEQLNWWLTMFPCTCIICTLCDTIYLGNACRSKVLNYLRRKFKSPAIAEVYYFPPVVAGHEISVAPASEMTPIQQLKHISDMFKSYVTSNPSLTVPDDFLVLAVAAMEHLKSCGRTSVVYNLVKVIGTMREDQSDSLLPVKCMPMGLIEHCVNFFGSTRQQVYRHTTFSHLGVMRTCTSLYQYNVGSLS